jgi:hypothetical protein
MKKLSISLYFVLLCLSTLISQTQANDPLILTEDIPGGTINRSVRYDGNSLWGYIDGGADIYLEYGFSKVFVQEIDWQSQQAKVELFEMTDQNAAFGIFSIYRNFCKTDSILDVPHCIMPYQIIAFKGKYYISIISSQSLDTQLMIRLAQIITGKIPKDEFTFPVIFSEKPLNQNLQSLKFIRGQLGLMNGCPQIEDQFANYSGLNIYTLSLSKDTNEITVAYVIFQSAMDMQRFCEENEFRESEYGFAFTRNENGVITKVKLFPPKDMLYLKTSSGDQRFIEPYFKLLDN